MENYDTVYHVDIMHKSGMRSEAQCDSLSEAIGWANESTYQDDVVAVYEAVRGSDGTIEKIYKVMGWMDDGYRSQS